jgi:hypothetical protein
LNIYSYMKNILTQAKLPIFEESPQKKRELIEGGAELLWEQCRLTAQLTGENMGSVLSKSLAKLELDVKIYQEKEQYELCYYLNEVIWLTHSIAQKARTDEPII